MKKLLLGALLLAFSYGTGHSQTYQRVIPTAQTAKDPLTENKERIAKAHAALFKLPYSKDYIRDVVVAEIKQNRRTVAPHFPERQPGSNSARIDEWINQYPDEVTAYLRYVGLTHRKYVLAKR